jgi:hypothetical protein
VPLDNFKLEIKARYFVFIAKVAQLSDHTRWICFDEKRLVKIWTRSMARSGRIHRPEEWIRLAFPEISEKRIDGVYNGKRKWNGRRFYEFNPESHHFWLVDDW